MHPRMLPNLPCLCRCMTLWGHCKMRLVRATQRAKGTQLLRDLMSNKSVHKLITHTHTHTEVTPTHTGLAPTKMKHKCELFPLTHIGCGHIRLLLLFSWWGSAATETVTHNACTVTHTLLNHHLNTLNWQHYLTININFLRIFGTEFLKTDFCESTMHWCRNLRKHAMIHDKALSAQYSFALSGYSRTFKCKVLI